MAGTFRYQPGSDYTGSSAELGSFFGADLFFFVSNDARTDRPLNIGVGNLVGSFSNVFEYDWSFAGSVQLTLAFGDQYAVLPATSGSVLFDASSFTADVVLGGGGYGDRLLGGSGDDTIHGGRDSANDTIRGGEGDDQITISGDPDVVDGGGGNDTLVLVGGTYGVDLRNGVLITSNGYPADELTSIENVRFAGDASGTVVASTVANRIEGGAGLVTVSYAFSASGVTIALNGLAGSGGDAEGDTLTGVENLIGSGHGDTLRGDADGNRLDGGGGDDSLFGLDGNDTLIGGTGADVLDGGVTGTDTASYETATAGVTASLSGPGTGGDALGDKLKNIDILVGSGFDDSLTGGALPATLVGGEGNDTLAGLAGTERLDGGNGFDLADYGASIAAIQADLAAGTITGGHATGDTLVSIEGLSGSAYDDDLAGNGGGNRLDGNGGDDVLAGRGGNDTLTGGDGADILLGGDGADLLRGGAGADALNGGTGNDTLSGGAGPDILNGSGGSDTVTYADAGAGVAASLTTGGTRGDARGDVFVAVEVLIGSGFRDTLSGSAGADTISGGEGDDVIAGLGGADNLQGGEGTDTLDYRASGAGVLVNLALGTGSSGDAAGDAVSGFERVLGSAAADTLIGSAAADRLEGGDGADSLVGADGNDVLSGGAGDDILFGGGDRDRLDGGAGDDVLVGGEGADTLTGGAGADVFRWDRAADSTRGARDVVLDFHAAEGDLLDLSTSGAAYAGDGAFVGGGGASATWRVQGPDLELRLDADGDGMADLSVLLRGVTALSAGDLLLFGTPS